MPGISSSATQSAPKMPLRYSSKASWLLSSKLMVPVLAPPVTIESRTWPLGSSSLDCVTVGANAIDSPVMRASLNAGVAGGAGGVPVSRTIASLTVSAVTGIGYLLSGVVIANELHIGRHEQPSTVRLGRAHGRYHGVHAGGGSGARVAPIAEELRDRVRMHHRRRIALTGARGRIDARDAQLPPAGRRTNRPRAVALRNERHRLPQGRQLLVVHPLGERHHQAHIGELAR